MVEKFEAQPFVSRKIVDEVRTITVRLVDGLCQR